MRSDWRRRWRRRFAVDQRHPGRAKREPGIQRLCGSRFRVQPTGCPGMTASTLTSLPRLAECRAEGVAGIDADNAEFAREELQFLQRKGKALVIRMTVNVGI